ENLHARAFSSRARMKCAKQAKHAASLFCLVDRIASSSVVPPKKTSSRASSIARPERAKRYDRHHDEHRPATCARRSRALPPKEIAFPSATQRPHPRRTPRCRNTAQPPIWCGFVSFQRAKRSERVKQLESSRSGQPPRRGAGRGEWIRTTDP